MAKDEDLTLLYGKFLKLITQEHGQWVPAAVAMFDNYRYLKQKIRLHKLASELFDSMEYCLMADKDTASRLLKEQAARYAHGIDQLEARLEKLCAESQRLLDAVISGLEK